MKIEKRTTFACLVLVLIFFSTSIQNNNKYSDDLTQEDLSIRPSDLRNAGFWNNFTFIHITNLNWTTASSKDWCSGLGTWEDPYVIENMIINASASPTGAGIFIENSIDVYFTIRNVTIFEGTNGIKLENTNRGTLDNNVLSDNIETGIYLVNNCVNNTISRNQLINNGGNGIALFSNCNENKIVGNTAKNDGSYQQDYGIRLDSNCLQNNISLNVIEDINNYGIWLVTSDQNHISNNKIIDTNTGFYLLLADQSELIGNKISGGYIAISISGSYECDIIGNFINDTSNYGIRIFTNSDNNEFYDNIIKDIDGVGVQLDEPLNDNNLFYKNSFISNGLHAYDNGTATFWNFTMVGNYWDNYSGVDLNNDHIGDTPHNISGASNANDSLPIVDHGPPSISIITPTSSKYGATAPDFNIFINEPYIYSMWYTINNSGKKYYFTENGTININAWNALNDGNLTVTFYARDYALNTGFTSVIIIKSTSQVPDDPDDPDNPNDGSPPINIVFIVIISVIVIVVIAMVGIITKARPSKRKIPKLQELDEEQLIKAQYFKDATSILTVVAMHNESGLCLSKFAIHNGNGLDEHLFTGFISAIGSFKNELAKQMGLRVGGEGGDNVIEYNEFTITLMDGEYLRLGLVSYSKLGSLVKERCDRVLRAYENKHINDLKNFDGEIQIFSDFEEAVEVGLELTLNRKCSVNIKQLNNYDAPEAFKAILNNFNSKKDAFYPAKLAKHLKQELSISEQEANFMVYKAYKNQVFMPIK